MNDQDSFSAKTVPGLHWVLFRPLGKRKEGLGSTALGTLSSVAAVPAPAPWHSRVWAVPGGWPWAPGPCATRSQGHSAGLCPGTGNTQEQQSCVLGSPSARCCAEHTQQSQEQCARRAEPSVEL